MNHKFLSTLFLPLLLLSCEKEQEGKEYESPIIDSRTSELEFSVTFENTKTILDGKSIVFEVGDSLAVWDGDSLRCFVAEASSDKIVFRGRAAKSSEYWSLYPWTKDCSVSTSSGKPVFSTKLSTVQQARNGSFDRKSSLAIGKSGSDFIMTMKNICGYLKYSFPASEIGAQKPGGLDKLIFTSKGGAKIAGDFNVSLDNEGIPELSGLVKHSGDDAITIQYSDEMPAAGGTYYIAALPVDLSSGVRVNFTRNTDCATAAISSGSKTNILQRCKIMNLGAFRPDWTPADGEEADDSTPDPTGSFDYSLLSRESHPRVLMNDKDFRILSNYLKNDSYPILNTMHQKIINLADDKLSTTFPTLAEIVSDYPDFKVQKNQHLEKIARVSQEILFSCAYAYRTTSQSKYLEKCKSVLTQLCADDNWLPASFLSTAEIAFGVAIAYDWLYYDLTKSQRTEIRQNLCTKAINARKSSTLTSLSNAGQVYNSGLLAAALAVYEKDKTSAAGLIEESITNVATIVDAIYYPKGSYFEGYSYWGLGTNFQCLYNENLINCFGTDSGLSENSGFKESGKYMLYMSDSVSSFGYSDGGKATPDQKPAMWWYAAHYQKSSYLLNELLYLSSDARLAPMIPCCLAKYPPLDTEVITPPSDAVWVDDNNAVCPVLMVRDGWKGDESDTFLGLKGGKANVNHGHMDVGSFAFHSEGQKWASEVRQKTYSVYTTQGLEGREQKSGTWKALVYSSLGHNTMSFANYSGSIEKIHPTDHIVDAKATIEASYPKGGKLLLTPIYEGQVSYASRKAEINENGNLIITDEITALKDENAKLIWRMVTPASITENGDYFTLTRGGKTRYFSTACTSGTVTDFTLCNWGAFKNARPSAGQWGWNDEVTWDEVHTGWRIIGFTLTVPKNTSVSLRTTISKYFPEVEGNVGFDNLTDSKVDFKW